MSELQFHVKEGLQLYMHVHHTSSILIINSEVGVTVGGNIAKTVLRSPMLLPVWLELLQNRKLKIENI